MIALTKGQIFGQWALLSKIQAGGNGVVWLVAAPRGDSAAIKVLSKFKESAYKRFRGEVAILSTHCGVPGLMPVLDKHLPDVLTEQDPPWYVMPLAVDINSAIASTVKGDTARRIRVAVRIAAEVGGTLALLHEAGVSHRDLKPANLLFWNGRARVGDFGIADYPDKPDLTGAGEPLGPRWTMAPEMRRAPKEADPRAADVYSLAKTLWILLTQQAKGFEGQYLRGGGSLALRQYFPTAPLLHELESLIHSATSNDPAARPPMGQVVATLQSWLARSESFQHASLGDWKHVQNALFPLGVPERVEWRDQASVVAILNLLSQTARLNHAFAPEGGGFDLSGAGPSNEQGCVELRFEQKIAVVVKIERLLFESFPGAEDWAYFRLECAPLAPSGVYESVIGRFEELLEISPGDYLDRSYYDQGFIECDAASGEPIPLPNSARVVSRLRGGAFVVFAKASEFNAIDTYQGKHDLMTADQFRNAIERAVARAQARAGNSIRED